MAVAVHYELASDGTESVCLECIKARGTVQQPLVIEQPPEAPKRRPPSASVKKRATEMEFRDAKMVGGRRQPGSGNMEGFKGDVRAYRRWRMDSKTVRTDSYRLTRDLILKARSECGPMERMAIPIHFLSKSTGAEKDCVVVVDRKTFEDAVHALDDR